MIGLEPLVSASTAAAWESQGEDQAASARALAHAVPLASGFTDAVRSQATEFAQAWAALTDALADRCRRQGAALSATADGLASADEASRDEIGSVAAALGGF